jgi:transcriptional regulator with XRE-family HTH domain
MNVEPYSLRRLEAGKANPTLGTLLSVAAAFRIALTDLLSTDDPDA